MITQKILKEYLEYKDGDLFWIYDILYDDRAQKLTFLQ